MSISLNFLKMDAYLQQILLLLSLSCFLSHPVFPKTYYASFVLSIADRTGSYLDKTEEGYIAEDYKNKLAVLSYETDRINELTPQHPRYKVLYSDKQFYINNDFCTCYDRSYSESGFPFLASFHNYRLYSRNNSVIWWEAENDKYPFTLNNHKTYKVLLGVLAKQPNIPVSFGELPPKQVDFNISFTHFYDEAPPKELFDIPESCTKAMAKNGCKRLVN